MKYIKALTAATAVTVSFANVALAEGEAHFVAIHVDENDPQVMNMALNNAANVNAYYLAQGDTVTIEIVTYGPGLNMVLEGKSPVADRISAMSLEIPNISFAACENTLRSMNAKTGIENVVLAEASVVPSGVVRLITLQEEGYSYIRP
tara:strand:+ start:40173 stop:40616 length:444 start_codon:yes stop_codon:yes gene_type:complete